MLAFFGSTFPLNLQLWNKIRMRWNIISLQGCRRRNFDPFWLCWSDFWRPCAPPKTCPNQKSFWDPLNQPPNTTGMGWEFWFSKKHVWLGHPTIHLFATNNPVLFHTFCAMSLFHYIYKKRFELGLCSCTVHSECWFWLLVHFKPAAAVVVLATAGKQNTI